MNNDQSPMGNKTEPIQGIALTITSSAVRRDYTQWWNSKRVEHLIEGLRKAGLEIPNEQ